MMSDSQSDFSKLSVKVLRERAAKLTIPGRSKMRKSDLIDALLAFEKSEAKLPNAAPGVPASILDYSDRELFPHGNPGLPIPKQYGQNKIHLLAQDPEHLFAYWEISEEQMAAYQDEYGMDMQAFLIIDGPHGRDLRTVYLDAGNYYFNVIPREQYRVHIAITKADETQSEATILLSSNEVTVAGDSVADYAEGQDNTFMFIDENGEKHFITPTESSDHTHRDRYGNIISIPGVDDLDPQQLAAAIGLSSADLQRTIAEWRKQTMPGSASSEQLIREDQ